MLRHRLVRWQIGAPALEPVSQPDGDESTVRPSHSEVRLLVIRGSAEQNLPATDIRVPDHVPSVVGIERPYRAGLLTGEDERATIGQINQNSSRGEIPVGIVCLV